MLLPDTFQDFVHRSILDKKVFCLGENQGMIVNDDCSLWYNRVGDFLMSVWERRKDGERGSVCKVSQNDPTLECEANGNNCNGG